VGADKKFIESAGEGIRADLWSVIGYDSESCHYPAPRVSNLIVDGQYSPVESQQQIVL
jgi:hypothetical protein